MSDPIAWLDERDRIHRAIPATAQGEWSDSFTPSETHSPAHGLIETGEHEARIDLYDGSGLTAAAIVDAHNSLPSLTAALRAVLNLHKPVEIEPSETICGACSHKRITGHWAQYVPAVEWPCPTITAITTALGIEASTDE